MKNKKIMMLFATLLFIGVTFVLANSSNEIMQLKASTVVSNGQFRLSAINSWDGTAIKNYADLKWDNIPNLSQAGYQLYQSEDGINWEQRSLKYDKAIKVLNVYPNIAASNTLKTWMDGLGLKDNEGRNLIQVTPVTQVNFNNNPDGYLKNNKGDYQYDVVMFGSWDSNNGADLNTNASKAVKSYIDSGYGVLFGHDTVSNRPGFNNFETALGTTIKRQIGAPSDIRTGGSTIRVANDGYLMKFPFELANQQILTIPLAHNGQFASKTVGTNWIMFAPPYTLFSKVMWENQEWTMGSYLRTNNNVGMIQTGHSNGTSTIDERKIIANTLYNLAQVSYDEFGNDQTVKDDWAPDLPIASLNSGGVISNFSLNINSVDRGKEYQWYIEANTRNGIQKSDTVKEEITSNIAGYFYKIDDQASSDLNSTVAGYKDEFGRIDPAKYNLYVAPITGNLNLTSYDTNATILNIDGLANANKYLHIVAVDRSNNISEVRNYQIKDLMNQFRVTEKYMTTTGQVIQKETFQDFSKNTNYNRKFPFIANYKVKSYKVDNNKENNANSDTTVVIDNLKNNHTVTYIYDKLKDFTIVEKYVDEKGGAIRTDISKKVQEGSNYESGVSEIPDYTIKTYKLNGEGEKPATSGTIVKIDNVNQDHTIVYKYEKNKYTITQKYQDLKGKQLQPDTFSQVTHGEDYQSKSKIIPNYLVKSYQIGTDSEKLINESEVVTLKKVNGNQTVIYKYNEFVTLNIRQIILTPSQDLVIPKEGHIEVESSGKINQLKDETIYSVTINSGDENQTVEFSRTQFIKKISDSQLKINAIIPQYYRYEGYILTPNEEVHETGGRKKEEFLLEYQDQREFWITIYLSPSLEENQQPKPFSWSSKKNNFGKINRN